MMLLVSMVPCLGHALTPSPQKADRRSQPVLEALERPEGGQTSPPGILELTGTWCRAWLCCLQAHRQGGKGWLRDHPLTPRWPMTAAMLLDQNKITADGGPGEEDPIQLQTCSPQHQTLLHSHSGA